MALDIQLPASEQRGRTAGPDRQGASGRSRTRRVSGKDRMFFTEQLALLLSTGTSLHPALLSIAQQMGNRPMRPVVEAMAEGVMGGRSLSEEMHRHPQAFSPMYVTLVAASESGGFLSEVLEQLRGMEEQNETLKSTLISAFSYPAFLVVFSIFTLVFILVGVFPKFAEMFTAIGDHLPSTTRVLMALSGFLIQHWVAVLVGVGVVVIGAGWWLGTAGGRLFVDRAKLHAPLLGSIWQRVYVVLMFRVLGLSLQHGVSLVDAVRSSRELINNGLVRDFLRDLSDTLEQGDRLGKGVEGVSWLPDLAKQMLITGEESGSLAPVMLRLSDHYNRELERALQSFSRLVEPVMLVVMGAMVGLIVSALILPIFKLSHAVT